MKKTLMFIATVVLSLFCAGLQAEDFKTPEKFAAVPAEQLIKFGPQAFNPQKIVEDKTAVTGKAVRFCSRNAAQDKEWHSKPDGKGCSKYVIAIHNRTDNKQLWESLKGRQVQQDEKYHWFCFRNVKFGAKTFFWAWKEWVLADLSSAYKKDQANVYDVWVSCKVTGPSYVAGSKLEDNIFLECIILTPPGAVK